MNVLHTTWLKTLKSFHNIFFFPVTKMFHVFHTCQFLSITSSQCNWKILVLLSVVWKAHITISRADYPLTAVIMPVFFFFLFNAHAVCICIICLTWNLKKNTSNPLMLCSADTTFTCCTTESNTYKWKCVFSWVVAELIPKPGNIQHFLKLFKTFCLIQL